MLDSTLITIPMGYDMPCEALHFAWRNEGFHSAIFTLVKARSETTRLAASAPPHNSHPDDPKWRRNPLKWLKTDSKMALGIPRFRAPLEEGGG